MEVFFDLPVGKREVKNGYQRACNLFFLNWSSHLFQNAHGQKLGNLLVLFGFLAKQKQT